MNSATFYMDDDLLQYIEEEAERYGISRSMALRRMVMMCRATPNLRLFG